MRLLLLALGCQDEPKTQPHDTTPDTSSPVETADTAAPTESTDTGDPPVEIPEAVWLTGSARQFAGGVSALDIDGDGSAELAVGGMSDVWVLSAPWSEGILDGEADWKTSGSYGVALLADLTGDGIGDLVSDGDCSANVFAGPFTATPEPYAALEIDVAESFVRCGDIDGDGDEELCTGTSFNCSVSNEVPAALVFATPLPPALLDAGNAALVIQAEGLDLRVDAADLDGEGRAELVVAAPESDPGGSIWLVRDPAPGTFDLDDAAASWVGTKDAEAGMALASGDLDSDGQVDLVIGAPDYNDPAYTGYYGAPKIGRAYVALDDAGGPLEALPIVLLAASEDGRGMGTALAVGDLDGDGDADLAVSEIAHWPPGPGRVAVHLGPLPGGVRAWSDADLVLPGWGPDDYYGLSLDTADLDGDGRLDLAVAGTGDRGGVSRPGAVHLLFGASMFP